MCPFEFFVLSSKVWLLHRFILDENINKEKTFTVLFDIVLVFFVINGFCIAKMVIFENTAQF